MASDEVNLLHFDNDVVVENSTPPSGGRILKVASLILMLGIITSIVALFLPMMILKSTGPEILSTNGDIYTYPFHHDQEPLSVAWFALSTYLAPGAFSLIAIISILSCSRTGCNICWMFFILIAVVISGGTYSSVFSSLHENFDKLSSIDARLDSGIFVYYSSLFLFIIGSITIAFSSTCCGCENQRSRRRTVSV